MNDIAQMSESIVGQADILVIGGGLHGTSSAFHLAGRGASVIVLEADYVARHSSGVNAGGVRTLDALLEVMSVGVTRVGATATESILEDFKARGRTPHEARTAPRGG